MNPAVNPAVAKTGQVVIAVTGTAVPLSATASRLDNGVIVKSKSTNSSTGQTVGGSTVTNTVDGTGNGYILDPGEAGSFGITDLSLVYVNGTAGDIFSYEGN